MDSGVDTNASPDRHSFRVATNLHHLSKDSTNVLAYLLVHGLDLNIVRLDLEGVFVPTFSFEQYNIASKIPRLLIVDSIAGPAVFKFKHE